MKKWLSFVVVACLAFTAMSFSSSYKKLWEKYEASIEKGLPRSSMESLSEIMEKSKNSKDIGHYFKAYVLYNTIEEYIGEIEEKSSIQNLEEWLQNTKEKEDQAILSAILLHEYFNFYRNNQFAISERTDVISNDSVLSNIDLWSDKQFKEKFKYLYYRIFKDKDLLLKKSAKDYTPFIEINPFGEYFNHDLFHVLFGFTLSIQEQSLFNYQNEDWTFAMSIDAALEEYRDNREATLLLKLEKIKRMTHDRVHPYESYDSSREKKLQELDLLIDEYQDSELVVEAIHEKAVILLNSKEREGNYLKVAELSEQYIAKYPNYSRINILKNLLNEVKSESFQLDFPSRIHTNEIIFRDLSYRNAQWAKIEIYEVPDVSVFTDDSLLNNQFVSANCQLIKTHKLDNLYNSEYRSQKIDSIDYKINKEGIYLVGLSTSKNTQEEYKWLYVSDVKIITSNFSYKNNRSIDFFSVDALSGHPISNIKIELMDRRKDKYISSIETNEVGRASYNLNDLKDDLYISEIKVYRGQQYLFSENIYIPYRNSYAAEDNIDENVAMKMFMSREIYRPGQSVQLKGYVFQQQEGHFEVVSNYRDTLIISDNSGAELLKQAIETNDFGTFSIDFNLPDKVLPGYMQVRSQKGNGYTSFLVEEYKRPTFTIEFLPVEGKYAAGDTITLKGKVDSFSGSLLNKARVKAEVSTFTYNMMPLPRPCFFVIQGKEKLLTHNEIELDNAATFYLKIPTTNEQDYYSVNIKVTSLGGETQDAHKEFLVGTDSYKLDNSVESVYEKNSPVNLSVYAKNFDNKRVEAKGAYTLERVEDSVGREAKYITEKQGSFVANDSLLIDFSVLPTATYRITYEGEGITSKLERVFTVYSEKEDAVPVSSGDWLHVKKATFGTTSPAEILYGTGDENAYVYIDIYSQDGVKLTEERVMSKVYQSFKLDYKAEYKDGIILSFIYFKNNKMYNRTIEIRRDVEEANLKLKWKTFRDKLLPGSKEEWSLEVLDQNDKPIEVEVMALMYDASLDELIPYYRNQFNFSLNPIVQIPSVYVNSPNISTEWYSSQFRDNSYEVKVLKFDELFLLSLFDVEPLRIRGASTRTNYHLRTDKVFTGSVAKANNMVLEESIVVNDAASPIAEGGASQIRSNFSELAFFKPHLKTNKKGIVGISFTAPEQLTKWNVRALAHTKTMNLGKIEDVVFTEKKFSITPNVPRFVRIGDEVILTSTLKNAGDKNQNVSVQLVLFNPYTEKQIYTVSQKVNVNSMSEESVNFELPKLDNLDAVGIRIIASNSKFSDGEQHIIPILSNEEPLVESKPVILQESGKSTISLADLFNKQSETAKNKELTIEFTANPTWFVIQPMLRIWNDKSISSLTYIQQLMASNIAYKLISENPLYFELDQSTGASYKMLSENESLRNIIMEESPWNLKSQTEKELFSQLRIKTIENTSPLVIYSLLSQLGKYQNADGGFSWYNGMDSNYYITFSIAQSLHYLMQGNMLKEGLEYEAKEMFENACHYLYQYLLKYYKFDNGNVNLYNNQLEVVLLTLGTPDFPFTKEEKLYNQQVVKNVPELLKKSDLLIKSNALRILLMDGDKKNANHFANSIKEHLLISQADGAHFGGRQYDQRNRVYQIETHIEAMKALYAWSKDENLLNQMKYWLAQKLERQDFINGLLLNDALFSISNLGENISIENSSIEIKVGNEWIKVNRENPYVKRTFNVDKQQIANISVLKEGSQIIWGGVYATFTEKLDQIESYQGDISVNTQYFIEKTKEGERVLESLNEGDFIEKGDVVVSRINFTVKNDLDLVFIKDSRAACLEPMDTQSGYRWGVLFFGPNHVPSYVAVRDASTQYFYNALKKGTYILENRSYVSRTGKYQSGIVTIQSMFAPELSGHSGSAYLNVK